MSDQPDHPNLYDYGPPTTVGDGPEDGGIPQDNSEAVDVDNEGDTPHTPPENADTIVVPGGSPSDEAIVSYDPNIDSLEPMTAAVGSEVTVSVTGSQFTPSSVVEADQAEVPTTYVSGSELTATLADPGAAGTVSVTVRTPGNEQESNTVDFTFTAAQADDEPASTRKKK